MDHDVIVESWLDRCKRFMENMLQAPDLHRVASASLTIFAQMRPVARDMLQAKITLEAEERRRADVIPCCQEARVTSGHTRTVSPGTLLGEMTMLANVYAGLEMGIDSFDACVGGLGGCPFAGHAGASGNVCSEDIVFMCQEMGIETGIDLDQLIDCAKMAEEIVGHPLPGKAMKGGNLRKYREAAALARHA